MVLAGLIQCMIFMCYIILPLINSLPSTLFPMHVKFIRAYYESILPHIERAIKALIFYLVNCPFIWLTDPELEEQTNDLKLCAIKSPKFILKNLYLWA